MSEPSNGSNLPPVRGLRGIMKLRAELAYKRRGQERRVESEHDAYVDSSERTPEQLEQRRLDRLQRKLYRDSEDVSQLTSAQLGERMLEIARNEVNEVYNSPEALQLDMRTSDGRRRLRELVSEAHERHIPQYMNIANNNAPLQVESIGTDGILPERARWGQEVGKRAMQAAKREVDAVYDSPAGLSAYRLGDQQRLHNLMAEAREKRLAADKPQMTPAQLAEATRKELGWKRFIPKLFGGSTKRRKTRGKKSRGTRQRRRS